MTRPNQTKALLDITDVLFQVYKKIDTAKYPEILVNKLVNYIYIVGFDNKIRFIDNDEKLLIELGIFLKKLELIVNIKQTLQINRNFIVIQKQCLNDKI